MIQDERDDGANGDNDDADDDRRLMISMLNLWSPLHHHHGVPSGGDDIKQVLHSLALAMAKGRYQQCMKWIYPHRGLVSVTTGSYVM